MPVSELLGISLPAETGNDSLGYCSLAPELVRLYHDKSGCFSTLSVWVCKYI